MKYAILSVLAPLFLFGFGCAAKPPANQNANAAAPVEEKKAEETISPEAATTTPAPNTTNTNTSTKPKTTTSGTAPKTSFYVEADDKGFYPSSGTARKGSMVTVTFKVRTSNVIYNGLLIKSNKYDLGTIKGGSSKSVLFPAESNITFSSFWETGAYRGAWTLYVK